MKTENIAGQYVYRSLHNNQNLGEDFSKLRFGEGIISLTQTDESNVSGELDMGGDYKLILNGIVEGFDNHVALYMKGEGLGNTPTEGWIYEYSGYVAYSWPNGIDQIKTITGTVVRSADHGNSGAGYTGSFIMVKRSNP